MLRDAGLTFGGRPRLRRWWSRPTDPGRAWTVARLAVALVVGVLLLGPELLGGAPPPVFSGPLAQTVTTPGPVRNLDAEGFSDGTLTVSWDAPQSNGGQQLTGYGIRWRRPDQGDSDDRLAVVDRHTTSYTITGRASLQEYEVSVHACNDYGCGPWSEETVTMPEAAGPPGPVGNVRIRDVTATSFTVKWNAPSSDGGRDIEGYGVRWKMDGDPVYQLWVGDEHARSHTVSGLSAGRTYMVSVQACNGTKACGMWSDDQEVTLQPPDPPGKVTDVSFDAVTASSFRVLWAAPSDTGSQPLTGYGVLHRPAGANWPGDGDAMVVGTWPRSLRYTGLATGQHETRIRACNGTGSCGDWSDDYPVTLQETTVEPVVTVTPGPTATPPPTPPDPQCPRTPTTPTDWALPKNLDVIPQPLRKALLCWTPVKQATSYVIEATYWPPAAGGNSWRVIQTLPDPASNPPAPFDHKWSIPLDAFYGSEGLAHNDGKYGLRVKALRPGQGGQGTDSSPYSGIIIIIDTPIRSANGASPADDSGTPGYIGGVRSGQAVVHWAPITDILGAAYGAGSAKFRVREIGEYTIGTGSNSVSYHHASPGWDPAQAVSRSSLRISDSTGNPHTVTGLSKSQLYAIQYVYEPPALHSSTKVFAARDVYVWPSDTRAFGGQRVASFPLSQRLQNKTYRYHICKETFVPSGVNNARRDKWLTLIQRAFEVWETATNNLVSTEAIISLCVDRMALIDKIMETVRQRASNDGSIPITDEDIRKYIMQHVRDLLDELQFRLIIDSNASQDYSKNEVLMYNDVDGHLRTFRDAGVFPDIADRLGYVEDCWYDRMTNMWSDKTKMCTVPVPIGGRVTSDIFIRRSHYEQGSASSLASPADTPRFNTCRNSTGDQSRAYSDFLHEVGHALGIGGGSRVDANSPRKWDYPGHPKIDDSVMNYNFGEPDCSPHLFDIMAIYALYKE